ncbi:hypothetical protein BGX34_004693 [Mortierella sp. NVP85]|nr:hypothetical protein BGX34_004693 [Mortierella sp. NVP85]
MSTARSKKQDSLQELKSGTVQRLSQQFLQASLSQPVTKLPLSPIRYQPLAIPETFMANSGAPPSSSSSTSSDRYSVSAPSPPTSNSSYRSSYYAGQPSAPSHSNQLPLQHPLLPAATSPQLTPRTSMGFDGSTEYSVGMSMNSVGSEESFASALSYIDSPKEPGSPKSVPLWKQMLDAIDQEDRQELDRILHAFDFAIVIQTLVTWNFSNTDNKYRHDPDVLLDAQELLGSTVDHINLIQIACFLFNEEMALDMLNFVAKASDELESKKILYEFMGKLWGDGNTTLHLASFLGMADLTKRLLDLGANVYKMNDRKYKPVDCADENTTRSLFLNLTEVVRYRRIPSESVPTSPTNDVEPEDSWASFKSLGHLRSPSTSMLPLSTQSSEESRFADHEGGTSNNSLHLRPASSLGIASQLKGLLMAESNQSELSLHPGSSLEGSKPDQSSQSSQSGSSACIEDLLLVDSRPTQVQDEESIPLAAAPSISTSSEVGSASPTAGTNGNATEMDTAKSLANFESGENGNLRLQISNNSASSSYASHIKPKLRSYQSSPSIRLYAEKSSSWESGSTSTCKKSKSAKRVSFDPQTLMADASRTGDLALYKSMLAILQEEGTSGTLKEIINYQSASRQLSSLHLAASYNHLELCRFLVEMGANVNLPDVEGWTPMHCAAAEGHLKVLEFLVKDPDADLQAATFEGEMIEEVVEDEDQRQKVIDILEAQSR